MDNGPSKEAILVVDDTPANPQILTRGLAARGYKVTVASTGQEAIDIAIDSQPQLILMDVLMPDMDGYEVCRRLKSDPRVRDIPVMFLSALPETVDKVKGFQAGAVDYLTKPFQFEEVFARVEAHLTLYRQRKQIEALLAQRELAEAAERQQYTVVNTLLRSAVALSSTLMLDEVLEHILLAVEQIVPNDLAMVILVDNDHGSVARVQSHLLSNWRAPTASFPIQEQGIVEAMLETRRPYVIADTWIEPLWTELRDLRSLHSFIGAPIFSDEQLIGILGLMALPADFYNEAMSQHLEAFAALAAFAIKNARLYEQARELAVVQERQRLARELHDSISQTLFSANALAEVLPRIIDNDGAKARHYMIELAQFTRAAMAEMRSLLFELRPEAFKGTELGVLVKQLCDMFTLQTNIAVDLRLLERVVLPERAQIALYRIAQEALVNVARHANATRVSVCLRRQPDGVELDIQDNGCGFDRQRVNGARGIKLMQERAKSIGASLLISSHPGQGTEVILRGIE
jgi:signal transduction histidine kinase